MKGPCINFSRMPGQYGSELQFGFEWPEYHILIMCIGLETNHCAFTLAGYNDTIMKHIIVYTKIHIAGIITRPIGQGLMHRCIHMGDIFGAPLALEALTAFFLESTFLGIWLFGWDKLSPKLHCACIWIVAFASNLSAFWILVANSFMWIGERLICDSFLIASGLTFALFSVCTIASTILGR